MFFIRNDSRLVPLSESRASGTPNVGITSSTSNWAIRTAFWSGVGKTIGHFVNKSWNTITYWFPLAVIGSSMMSTPTTWNGRSVAIGCSGGFFRLPVPCTMAH